MSIQKRFNELSPYLKGLKSADKYRMVEVNLKSTWKFIQNDEILFQVKEIEGKNFNYHLFYSETLSFDEILDWVQDYVIKTNLEMEQKQKLLKSKVDELKRIFEDKSLDELNSLQFITEDDLLINTGLNVNNNENDSIEKVESNDELIKE